LRDMKERELDGKKWRGIGKWKGRYVHDKKRGEKEMEDR